MRKAHRAQPRLDSLESRLLLTQPPSALHVVPALRSSAITPVASRKLAGTETGNYTTTAARPGVGVSYNLTGSGDVNMLGNHQIHGMISVSTLKGKTVRSGVITLSNGQGTLRLRIQNITGFEPMAVGSTPVTKAMALTYTIVGGTGTYRGLRGSGGISLKLVPTQITIDPPAKSDPVTGSSGGDSGTGGGGSGGTAPPVTSPTPSPRPTPPVKGNPPVRTNPPPGKKSPSNGHGGAGTGNNGGIKANVVPAGQIGTHPSSSGTFTLTFYGGPISLISTR